MYTAEEARSFSAEQWFELLAPKIAFHAKRLFRRESIRHLYEDLRSEAFALGWRECLKWADGSRKLPPSLWMAAKFLCWAVAGGQRLCGNSWCDAFQNVDQIRRGGDDRPSAISIHTRSTHYGDIPPYRQPKDNPAHLADVRDQLDALCEGLPEDAREYLRLKMEGYSLPEASRKLGKSVTHLGRRLRAIRDRAEQLGLTE